MFCKLISISWLNPLLFHNKRIAHFVVKMIVWEWKLKNSPSAYNLRELWIGFKRSENKFLWLVCEFIKRNGEYRDESDCGDWAEQAYLWKTFYYSASGKEVSISFMPEWCNAYKTLYCKVNENFVPTGW